MWRGKGEQCAYCVVKIKVITLKLDLCNWSNLSPIFMLCCKHVSKLGNGLLKKNCMITLHFCLAKQHFHLFEAAYVCVRVRMHVRGVKWWLCLCGMEDVWIINIWSKINLQYLLFIKGAWFFFLNTLMISFYRVLLLISFHTCISVLV